MGYQTMDALASLVFGILIVASIKAAGVTDTRLHTRYTIYAGIIAALGLGLVYVSLIYLGAMSGTTVPADASGVQILTLYVERTFGTSGIVLLAAVILLACLTTGVGLVSACSAYFSQLLGVKYRTVVVVMSVFCACPALAVRMNCSRLCSPSAQAANGSRPSSTHAPMLCFFMTTVFLFIPAVLASALRAGRWPSVR